MTISTRDIVAPSPAPPLALGPDLPMSVYYAAERWHAERIGALALYCSDGRWGEAFDEFCHKHLHIPRYDRWAVPGGPAWLVAHDDDPTPLQAARTQLDFLVRIHEIDQIVLIAHYGCAVYCHRLGCSPEECLPTQLTDVRAAGQLLESWYPQVGIKAYLAMRRDNCLSFHE